MSTDDAPAGVRVMVVDDHPIWRDAVAADLAAAGYEIVAAVGDGDAAIRVAPAVHPDVVLMDLQLPTTSGVEAAGAIVAAAVGAGADVLLLRRGRRRARRGHGGRPRLPREVRGARRPARRRRADRPRAGGVLPGALAALVLGEYRRLADPARAAREADAPVLTERETEILKLTATGMSARQIAQRLVLSVRTVQNHTQNTLRKLQLHNRVELTRWAIEQGIAD